MTKFMGCSVCCRSHCDVTMQVCSWPDAGSAYNNSQAGCQGLQPVLLQVKPQRDQGMLACVQNVLQLCACDHARTHVHKNASCWHKVARQHCCCSFFMRLCSNASRTATNETYVWFCDQHVPTLTLPVHTEQLYSTAYI
jgi:hypothetical protein